VGHQHRASPLDLPAPLQKSPQKKSSQTSPHEGEIGRGNLRARLANLGSEKKEKDRKPTHGAQRSEKKKEESYLERRINLGSPLKPGQKKKEQPEKEGLADPRGKSIRLGVVGQGLVAVGKGIGWNIVRKE